MVILVLDLVSVIIVAQRAQKCELMLVVCSVPLAQYSECFYKVGPSFVTPGRLGTSIIAE